jgi:cysteine-rich repeat protein
MRMKNFADANHDRIVNPKEIRGGLVSVIRGVLVGNATYDVNDDGAVNKADTKEAVRVFRLLLGAVCGNAHLDAGEQCDDGGKVNGDGCDATCLFETSPPPSVCGDGAVGPGEECDDGNLLSGDGCSGSDHPNGGCTVEFCGDGYTDTDGIPDAEGMPIMRTQEACDEGGVCQGGTHDGERCTHFGFDAFCGTGNACVTIDTSSCLADCQLPE